MPGEGSGKHMPGGGESVGSLEGAESSGGGGLQFREWGEPVRLSVLMLAGQLQPSLGNSKAQILGKAQPFHALQGL